MGTWDGYGVTLPGQRRYICEYEKWLTDLTLPVVQRKERTNRYRIKTISISGKELDASQFNEINIKSRLLEASISSKRIRKGDVSFQPTETAGQTSYKGKSDFYNFDTTEAANIIYVSHENLIVSGDFTISFAGKFSLTYNTIFLEGDEPVICFGRAQLEDVCKKKTTKENNFWVQVELEKIREDVPMVGRRVPMVDRRGLPATATTKLPSNPYTRRLIERFMR